MMWLFRRKDNIKQSGSSCPQCSYCGSTNTKLIVCHGIDHPDYVKIWRGQRAWTYRCLDCRRDFYGDEPPGGINDQTKPEGDVIDDEEALHKAEEEIKKQVEKDEDRRCR